MRVVETWVVHGFGGLEFVDACTVPSEGEGSPQRIDETPVVEFQPRPRGLVAIPKLGVLALSFEEGEVVAANDTRTIPDVPEPPEREPIVLAGTARSASGRWLPRAFSVTVARGQLGRVALFPSPAGTSANGAGVLVARLGDDAGRPVPWAVLELEVSVPPSGSVHCRAQSDAYGDVRMALRRLPPLPKGLSHYDASLRVRFRADAAPDVPLDPDTLVSGRLVSTDAASEATDISLSVAPAVEQRVTSFNNPHGQLVVKPPS